MAKTLGDWFMYFAAVALLGTSLGQPPAMPVPLAPPATQEFQGHQFLANRQIKLPIKYDKTRNTIRQVILFVARNGENTWYQEAALPPDRDSFTYIANEDGVYWFTMVIEDLQGKREPEDITRTQPDLKVIVDTTKPHIQFTKANRSGEIEIVWSVEDKYPNENRTQVQFKALGASDMGWRPVTLPPGSKSGVRFSPGTNEAVLVKVTAFDMAMNKTEATYTFQAVSATSIATNPAPTSPVGVTPLPPASPSAPIGGPTPPVTTQGTTTSSQNWIPSPSGNTLDNSTPSAPPFPPNVPVVPPSSPPMPPVTTSPSISPQSFGSTQTVQPPINPGLPSTQPATNFGPSAPTPASPSYGAQTGSGTTLAAPALPTSPISPSPPPVAPVVPGPISPTTNQFGSTAPIHPTSPTFPVNTTQSTPSGSGFGNNNSLSNQALPVIDPRQSVIPAVPTGTGSNSSSTPTPVAVWSGPPASMPSVELTRANFISYLSFDLGYEVESHGPSGISRVDLWVTRDDGRTWLKWSQHDGKGSSLRVNLNAPTNPQPEGNYGFRVVPVSGAGLSEREPTSGDTPDLRVVVDITPPQLDLFPPVSDPTSSDTLVIQWKATDKNFGDDPITIEWSDKPTGPWQPVASGGEVVQATAGTGPVLRRLPNTGQYAWRVPAGLSPRVYLKVCARDAAGNVREVITRDPILVDLVKPRAKISGIVPPSSSSIPKP